VGSDQEGRILARKEIRGSENSGSMFRVNLLLLGREAKQRQPVENDFELLVGEK